MRFKVARSDVHNALSRWSLISISHAMKMMFIGCVWNVGDAAFGALDDFV
jgi:hypothetical protein